MDTLELTVVQLDALIGGAPPVKYIYDENGNIIGYTGKPYS